MAQELEQAADEQVWIPVGRSFEYLVERKYDNVNSIFQGLKDGSLKMVRNDKISTAGGAYPETRPYELIGEHKDD